MFWNGETFRHNYRQNWLAASPSANTDRRKVITKQLWRQTILLLRLNINTSTRAVSRARLIRDRIDGTDEGHAEEQMSPTMVERFGAELFHSISHTVSNQAQNAQNQQVKPVANMQVP